MKRQSSDIFIPGGWTTFIAAGLLSLISIFLIYSANHLSPDPRLQDDFIKQTIWLFGGIGIFFAVALVPMRVHEVFAYVYYIGACALLLGLIFFGSSKFGGQRWYSLGFFSVQPSELAKIAFIFTLARFLTYYRKPISSLRKIIIACAICGFISVLVLRQPDLGSALIFVVMFLVMMFWAGMPTRYLLLLITPVISVIASSSVYSWIIFFVVLLVAVLLLLRRSMRFMILLVAVNLVVGALSSIAWNQLHDYQKMRIKIFLDPGQDPLGAGYQIIQSKVAIGSGGLLGKGYLSGSQNKLDYLPLRHTDFIFSVGAEEFGMLGAMIIVILFAVLIYKGLQSAQRTRSDFASLVAIGATTAIAFQMFVNIGMVLGLLPVTGVPLPFVSYGGSSMLACWVLAGLIANTERNWQEY